MKRRIVFWGILTVFCAVLAAGAQAKETEMYFNDFSDAASLSDFSSIKGNWNIQNGTLSTGSGTALPISRIRSLWNMRVRIFVPRWIFLDILPPVDF